MNKYIPVLCLLFLSACANTPNITRHESPGNLAATDPLPCVAATSVKNTSSAADISAGAKECAAKQEYDRAAELIMVATAYAFYDTLRVADPSAHGALGALFAKDFGPMPEFQMSNVVASMDALDNDEKRKRELCSHLRSSSPPAYMPGYMIAHGMGAFTGEPK